MLNFAINFDNETIADIEKRYEENIIFFSKMICDVKQNHMEDDSQADYIFKKILDLALWTVTEIQRKDAYKYLQQQYISEEVRLKWEKVQAQKGDKLTIKDLLLKNDGGLIHEHVIQRKDLAGKLKEAKPPTDICKILKESVACVVTKSEDNKLRESDKKNSLTGWDRYSAANIKVYDRKEHDWKILSADLT